MTAKQAIDFPPMPEPELGFEGDCEEWSHAYSAQQMRDYVAADRAQRQAGQEPVAKVLSWTNGSYSRNYKLEWLKNVPEGTELYTAPPAAPVPEGYTGSTLLSNPDGTAKLMVHFANAALAGKVQAALAGEDAPF